MSFIGHVVWSIRFSGPDARLKGGKWIYPDRFPSGARSPPVTMTTCATNGNDLGKTIQRLFLRISSLFLIFFIVHRCGSDWEKDHTAWACFECGGYGLVRPCITCNGKCGELWMRDLKMVLNSVQPALVPCAIYYPLPCYD